jgi:hypothetical protein
MSDEFANDWYEVDVEGEYVGATLKEGEYLRATLNADVSPPNREVCHVTLHKDCITVTVWANTAVGEFVAEHTFHDKELIRLAKEKYRNA